MRSQVPVPIRSLPRRPPAARSACALAACVLAACALAACVLAACVLAVPEAQADPILEVPPAGRGTLVRDSGGAPRLALVGEAQLLAGLAAGALATYPELGPLAGGELALSLARVGVVARGRATALSLRVDLSEALRPDRDEESSAQGTLAVVGRFVDDAAVFWTPRPWASVVAGRFAVPYARHRQLERTRLSAGVAPLLAEGRAPDRRWGATFHGDVGALAYAAGVYADHDALEARGPDDPSAGGQALAIAYVGWTPRAPIGTDFLPTPRSDPWYGTMRLFAGMGVAWRRGDHGHRYDLSLAGQLKYRRFAAMGEALLAPGQIRDSGVALEASVLVHERLIVLSLAEAAAGTWRAGGGLSCFLTRDRKSRASLLGWVRRSADDTAARDALLLQLQLAL